MQNYVTNYNSLWDDLFLCGNEMNFSNLMKTDIKETKDGYIFIVELPNVKKEDVNITLDEGYLKINANIKDEINEDEKYIMRERKFGSFSRRYFLGHNVKIEDVSAKMDNGLLIINIKKPTEEEKRININID